MKDAHDEHCDNGLIRLNKFLVLCGVCSRRRADKLISDGMVGVNDKTESSPGFKVSLEDRVTVNGRQVFPVQEKEYIALNKPVAVVTSMHDPEKRKTVLDLLPDYLKKSRMFPIGRLDYFSEGLLLLTNDGELANRLMHPRYEHEKTYEVKVRGKVDKKDLKKMASGMTLPDGTQLLPVRTSIKACPGTDTVLSMTLREGKNRQIRRMCETLNLVILSLKRTAVASVKLGDLKIGQWRRLTHREIEELKNLSASGKKERKPA